MLFWDKCQIIFRVYFLCFRGFALQNDTFYLIYLSFCLHMRNFWCTFAGENIKSLAFSKRFRGFHLH